MEVNCDDSTNVTVALVTPSQSVTPVVPRIRSEALIGLRGLASLHILLFHALSFSPLHMNLLGTMEMPLFFLLSGYSLALSYGRTTYHGYTSCCCTNTTQPDEEQTLLFKSFNFYRNRFARVMPIYYLVNFVIALPLLSFGHGRIALADDDFVSKLITMIIDSVAPIGMILPDLLWPFVAAGWTISTLWFFYLLFPVFLPVFQKYTNEDASRWIVILFWIQLIGGSILFTVLALKPLPWPYIQAYWVSTGWGLSRLPVFLIGIHAGLIRLRQYNDPNIRHRSIALNFIYAWLPWHCRCLSQKTLDQQYDEPATQRRWGAVVTAVSISHVVLIITFTIADSLVNNRLLGGMVSWAIQLLGVHSLLTVIDGLTRDGGTSILSKICNLWLTQELGRISLTLYLIHMPFMDWLCAAVKGNLNNKPPVFDKHIIPVWGIPVIVISCPVVAWVLTRYVEEPMKKLIRVNTNTS